MPDHALKHAHEAGDEAVDVAGVVDAGRLQHHQRAKQRGRRGLQEVEHDYDNMLIISNLPKELWRNILDAEHVTIAL